MSSVLLSSFSSKTTLVPRLDRDIFDLLKSNTKHAHHFDFEYLERATTKKTSILEQTPASNSVDRDPNLDRDSSFEQSRRQFKQPVETCREDYIKMKSANFLAIMIIAMILEFSQAFAVLFKKDITSIAVVPVGSITTLTSIYTSINTQVISPTVAVWSNAYTTQSTTIPIVTPTPSVVTSVTTK